MTFNFHNILFNDVQSQVVIVTDYHIDGVGFVETEDSHQVGFEHRFPSTWPRSRRVDCWIKMTVL